MTCAVSPKKSSQPTRNLHDSSAVKHLASLSAGDASWLRVCICGQVKASSIRNLGSSIQQPASSIGASRLISALTKQQSFRSADRRGAGPKMGAALGVASGVRRAKVPLESIFIL